MNIICNLTKREIFDPTNQHNCDQVPFEIYNYIDRERSDKSVYVGVCVSLILAFVHFQRCSHMHYSFKTMERCLEKRYNKKGRKTRYAYEETN